jgi:hypothetical protein
VNVFKNDFGYSNEADYRDFDVYKVVSDIQRSRPVLLRGCRTSKKVLLWFTYSDCHAWVCDGARLITSRNTTVRYMHMNWGWGESGANDWYLDFQNGTSNYQYQKKMGVNIHP